MSQTLAAVVRFHDASRDAELGRALFSLLCQPYRPLHVHVVTQRFSTSEMLRLRRAMAQLDTLAEGAAMSIINVPSPPGVDARSLLLNAGIEASKSRYLAFLDYDDVVHTPLYEALIARLVATGDALAFAGVAVKRVEPCGDALLVSERSNPFGAGAGLIDLWRANHCPIHSFVVDRTRVRAGDLHFDPRLTKLEDYEFLLRMTSRYRCDFALKASQLADYYWKSDGSNTIPQGHVQNAAVREWSGARTRLDAYRARAPISPAVRERLGLEGLHPAATIRDVLDEQSGGVQQVPEPQPTAAMRGRKAGGRRGAA